MRLTKEEIVSIKQVALSLDPNAKVYVLGSRLDDSKKGGDIDLLIESEILNRVSLLSFASELDRSLGSKKIDLVLYHPSKRNSTYAEEMKKLAQEI